MKLRGLFSAGILALSLVFSVVVNASDVAINADANDVAVKGYDVVAYFTDDAAKKGSSEYTAVYDNAIYQFTSASHRDLFNKNPKKYVPEFGGYCAFGVTLKQKFDTDPEAFKIVDGKLYLNLNKKVQKTWLKDTSGYINTADTNWTEIKEVPQKELDAKS